MMPRTRVIRFRARLRTRSVMPAAPHKLLLCKQLRIHGLRRLYVAGLGRAADA